MGIGIGYNDVVGDSQYDTKGTSAVFIPKVGVELWHFLRINCYAQLSRRGYNNFGASIGLVIGGRPKKQPKPARTAESEPIEQIEQ